MDELERDAILEELGFTVLGVESSVHGVSVGQASKRAYSGLLVPTVRISDNEEDHLTKLEDAWWRNAEEVSLFGADGTFFITIAGARPRDGWIHVRPPAERRFFPRLKELTGIADFLSLDSTGTKIVGVSEEEDEDWIVNTTPA